MLEQPSGLEPDRKRPAPGLSARMSVLARRHTTPELALRRELHRRGLRYRVQFHVPGNRRRTIDIAFTRVRLAVFVDGCFWHSCSQHGNRPATNSEWWRWKLNRNQERDDDSNRLLDLAGWTVLRIWEHEDVHAAADLVESTWCAKAAVMSASLRTTEDRNEKPTDFEA